MTQRATQKGRWRVTMMMGTHHCQDQVRGWGTCWQWLLIEDWLAEATCLFQHRKCLPFTLHHSIDSHPWMPHPHSLHHQAGREPSSQLGIGGGEPSSQPWIRGQENCMHTVELIAPPLTPLVTRLGQCCNQFCNLHHIISLPTNALLKRSW